ncbi:hypothetical protein CCB80_10225 [Armatimonadetes bacterium Uphvl-Ar1]|nr:hypothetical protein CCB80_10225 [Armatimonadetes bacterium Uphvl-Ar1]
MILFKENATHLVRIVVIPAFLISAALVAIVLRKFNSTVIRILDNLSSKVISGQEFESLLKCIGNAPFVSYRVIEKASKSLLMEFDGSLRNESRGVTLLLEKSTYFFPWTQKIMIYRNALWESVKGHSINLRHSSRSVLNRWASTIGSDESIKK